MDNQASVYAILKILDEEGEITKNSMYRLRVDSIKESGFVTTLDEVAMKDICDPSTYRIYVKALRAACEAFRDKRREIMEEGVTDPLEVMKAVIYSSAAIYINSKLSILHTEVADAIQQILAGNCKLEDFRPEQRDGPEYLGSGPEEQPGD